MQPRCELSIENLLASRFLSKRAERNEGNSKRTSAPGQGEKKMERRREGVGKDHPVPAAHHFSVACDRALRKESTTTQAILLWVVVQGFHYEEAMHDNLSPVATVIVNATKLTGTGRFVGHTYQFVLSCGKPKRGRI